MQVVQRNRDLLAAVKQDFCFRAFWKIDKNCCTHQILTSNQKLKCFLLLSSFQLIFEQVDLLKRKDQMIVDLTFLPHCLLWHCVALLFQKMCRVQSLFDFLPMKVSSAQDSRQISNHWGRGREVETVWSSCANGGECSEPARRSCVPQAKTGLQGWRWVYSVFPQFGILGSNLISPLRMWPVWDNLIYFNLK